MFAIEGGDIDQSCASCPQGHCLVLFIIITFMAPLLDHPTRWAFGSGFRNGTSGVTSCGLVCWAVFILASLGLRSGWECERPIPGQSRCHWQQVGYISLVPPGWFKAGTGVGHSLAILLQPWHLKPWRECGSQQPAAPSPLHWACSYPDHCPSSLCLLPPTLWVGCRLE